MKTFYLLRHEDVSGRSGTGVVAEGVIFDDGTGAFTWLSDIKTVTTFWKIAEVRKLHGHENRTEIVVESKHDKWQWCKEEARRIKNKKKDSANG